MNNDQEWRVLLLSELKEIKDDIKSIQKEMNTLKVKVAMFSSIVGAVSSIILNKIIGH